MRCSVVCVFLNSLALQAPRSTVVEELFLAGQLRGRYDDLPVLVGLKAEIASYAKFLEANDPLCNRIRLTHRIQNKKKEKQSRSTLALYLGSLKNA